MNVYDFANFNFKVIKPSTNKLIINSTYIEPHCERRSKPLHERLMPMYLESPYTLNVYRLFLISLIYIRFMSLYLYKPRQSSA